jgi:serine/threonine protein kinase
MVVGQYTVTKRLGSGAMGEVFLARDAALDRDVAVKRLLGDLDADTRRRFLREAQTVAKLRHPNIVSVHACGADEDGAPDMVMEYIPGPTF